MVAPADKTWSLITPREWAEEIPRHKGTSTAEHLKLVLSVIDRLEDE